VSETRALILPLRAGSPPVEADARMFSWSAAAIAGRLACGGADVAPGVRIAVLSIGGNWEPVLAESVYGALVAVRITAAKP
jgi:hypothetical protein